MVIFSKLLGSKLRVLLQREDDPRALAAAIKSPLTQLAGLRELTTDGKASHTKLRTRTGCVRFFAN